MTIHYLTDRTTKCGFTELEHGDSYTTDIEECDCPVCNWLILKGITKKLGVVLEPAKVIVPTCGQ